MLKGPEWNCVADFLAQRTARGGFTLVEIMVVTAIIGILAGIAIPSFSYCRRDARALVFVADLRVILDSLELYAMEHGNYPADAPCGQVPPGMEDYPPMRGWTQPTVLGGNWDWEWHASGVTAGVSVVGDRLSPTDFRAVDQKFDDGDLQTGNFRQFSDTRFTYIIMP
jgi:prepilin-type N-terminal cleavage/methylation domain-containing protein